MKTILEPTTATVIEKKSKFIANLFHVNTKEEAEAKIRDIQKQYHDARHHCFAYVVHEQEGIVERASDDGEPSGTAGAPMLQLLKRYELQNVLVVVTRYFGGNLLGTGGLVRAYSEATTKAIELATTVTEELGVEIEATLSYSEFEYFQYYCRKNNIMIINITYGDLIFCTLEATFQEKEQILHEMNENTLKIQDLKIKNEKYIKKKIEKTITKK